jgi:hypothetical protein
MVCCANRSWGEVVGMFAATSPVLRAAAIACFGVAVAGCTTSLTPPAAPSASVATTPATSAPATPATSAPASASATGTPTHPATGGGPSKSQSAASASVSPVPPGRGGGLAGCATRDLRVKAGAAQGAAGSVYQNIDFTNISATACTLYGYPGVALAAGTPIEQVGAAASRSTAASPATVTLGAGQTANALLRITQAENYPSGTCKPVATTYLQIYPPNQTTPIYLQYASTGCASTAVNLLSIGVVQAGAGS